MVLSASFHQITTFQVMPLASHMERAYSLAAHSEHLILLGIPPSEPDVGYGWIEPSVYLDPADYVNSAWPLSPVNRFWEKPDQRLAKALMDCGCLWNSFIMAGRVSAFLQSIRLALPNLMAAFESFQLSPSCRSKRAELSQLYSMLRPMSFSADVLAARPADLSVLCATGLGWSDLGDPGRVTSVLHQRGMKTQWASVSA
jgi:mannose-1-phosphate guanylyltransferase